MPSIRRLRPSIYTFDLGGFRIVTLLDFAEVRDGLGLSFAADSLKLFCVSLPLNHIDTDRYEHLFFPTLIDTGSATILFDTGLGAPNGALRSCLQELGIGPDVIDVVVLTHGHPDHIGGLIEDDRPVFARARYVFGAAEFAFWMKGEGIRDVRLKNRDLFMRTCAGLADRAIFVGTWPADRAGNHVHRCGGAFARADGVRGRERRAVPADLVGQMLALCRVHPASRLARAFR